MSEMPPGDPYVESVLSRVPEETARTLDPRQWEGLRTALRRSAPRRHAVDVRFVLPLYFIRLYCVLILGRDRRGRVERVLGERRRRASRFAVAAVLAVVVVALASVVFVLLYMLKSAAGIDIFPDFHLVER